MARTFDATIVKALQAQETDEAFLILLKINHSGFTAVRLVNNTSNITSNGSTFTAFPFNVILPADTEDTQPMFRITVPNAALNLIDELRGVAGSSTRISCDIMVIAASDPDTYMAEWTDFELTDVQYSAEMLSFNLSINWFLSEAFPAASFTPNHFPGIF